MADTHLTGVTIDPSSLAIAQVRGNSLTSEDAKNSLPLWIREMVEEYKESENNRTEEPNIPKVPEPNISKVPGKLKEKKEESYRPLAVSIGPYHYSDSEGKLQQVEKLKVRMMVKFVEDRTVTPREDLYVNLKEELQKARGCYDENITEKFSDEEFIKMMFIDGCFILQFMHCLNDESEKLEMSDQQIFHVKRDLLLLENQLPFAVLDSLREQRYTNLSDSNEIINNFLSLHIRSSGKPIQKWVRIALTALGLVMIPIFFPLFLIFLIISFCCACMFCPLCSVELLISLFQDVSLDWSPPPGKTQPDHLLQLLYYKSMYHYSKRNHKKARPGSRGHGLYYSAKNLKKAGILFRPRWTGAITDVKFKRSFLSRKVEVPPIIIDESTQSLLLNLVAYESAAALGQLWVSSYILFMDSLIDDAQDVEELRSNGIIINFLGADQKVAKLFNGMGESLTHGTYDTAAYNDVNMDINMQCESTVKIWLYDWKTTYFSNYFSSPWTFVAVLAASFGLGLTATQTYYTRFPPKYKITANASTLDFRVESDLLVFESISYDIYC